MRAAVQDRDPSEQEEEARLWRRFIQERSARDRERLFALYHPHACRIARRQLLNRRSGDIEYGDLCQLAATGLLEAIDRFEPDRDIPFAGFAARRIKGSIVNGIAKMSERRQQQSFRNRMRTDRARALIDQDADTLPTDDAFEALIDAAVALALGFMLEDTGLCVTSDQADRRPSAYDGLAWNETVRTLGREVAALPDPEGTIIRRHYIEGLDFATIAMILSVSRGRVSQLHRAGLSVLRKRLTRDDAVHLHG